MCFKCWEIYFWVWSWIFLRCQLSQLLTVFAGLVYLSDFFFKFLHCQLLRLFEISDYNWEFVHFSFQFCQCLIHAIKCSFNKQNAKLQILYDSTYMRCLEWSNAQAESIRVAVICWEDSGIGNYSLWAQSCSLERWQIQEIDYGNDYTTR